jgi:hypothetical protein
MPYIKHEDRVKLDGILQPALWYVNDHRDMTMGELNYFISNIIWSFFDANKNYSTANNLVGMLECVKQEFIRRNLNPYEDQKIKENGDI